MRIELRSGNVQLGPNQTLRVVDGAGSTVCAVEGSLWITEENQPRDIVLKPGACYRLDDKSVPMCCIDVAHDRPAGANLTHAHLNSWTDGLARPYAVGCSTTPARHESPPGRGSRTDN